MCQQPISARCLLLLVLGVLMFSDNQATSLLKRRKTSEDVDANLNSVNSKLDSVLKANRNLNIKLDTLVESVDKSRRKSKEETEKLEERVANKTGKIIERLNNKTEQLRERLDNKTEELRERLGNKTEQLRDQMKSQLGLQNRLMFFINYPEFIADFYKGRIYLLSKIERFNLDRDEKKCESLGGYLLEPDDLDEVKFVAKFVYRAVGDVYFYTGINDISNEGHFVHKYSGKPLKVAIWRYDQPSSDGDCTVLDIFGKLSDTVCSHHIQFVCEVPVQGL